ncbi:hypothetical protein [Kitasatospora kifunensis]|uniref:Uncharacterized protein n=1 Tax=Kitasatospora kifunensis TaxID=58351 RepID=A0A7W7R9W6_KITKI|nr:hypothetical protein [Kitasatospora kifunensis]MBB4927461.1 hypothetical protein [Kitasatospora kifunensis]
MVPLAHDARARCRPPSQALILALLNFLPALALGPLAEGLR